jgi:hypothetical protein
LKGTTEADETERRIVTGESWEEFCDTLKASGAAIMGMDSPKDPLTQAEGYRYLSRLVRAGLEAFIEYSDPKAPALRRMVHETVKIGADNPDNYYQNAVISGEYEYLITGKRNTVHFLGVSTQKGNYGGGRGLPPTGFLDASDLHLDDNGCFEIVVSCEKKGRNWLPMESDTGLLIVRQTFGNRDKEVPAELTIKRLGGENIPSPVTPQSVDHGLKTASQLVAGVSLLFSKWAKDFSKHTNQLPRMDPAKSNAAGGDPKIAYYHSYWKLEPEEALLIEAMPPDCEHWNFQLNNHWMESLDYRYFTIHVNKFTASYREDESVLIIVAHQDPRIVLHHDSTGCDVPERPKDYEKIVAEAPGTHREATRGTFGQQPLPMDTSYLPYNWITTTGHTCGTMCFRWIKADHHPQPKTRVIRFCDLPHILGSERGNPHHRSKRQSKTLHSTADNGDDLSKDKNE